MSAAASRQARALLCLGLLIAALGAAADDRLPKVLVIGIDGLRSDAFRSAAAPHLHGLAREGSFVPDAYADRVTRSGPGWTALLTGAWSAKHGVVDNTFAGYDPEAFPHVFRRLEEARPGCVTASLVNWEPLAGLAAHADVSRAFGDDDSVAVWAERLLSGRGGPDPDALFLHFDAPDFAGHRYGFSRFSPPYMAAIRRTDERAGRVLAALAARPGREREAWLVLVATDHGGTLRHHGEDIPACRRVPLIVSGDVEVAGGRLAGAGLADVAPTLLSHLGVPVDPRWGLDGRVLPLAPLGGIVSDRLSRQLPDLAEEEIR
jgi:predicted AlkP superfamily pyrophosphatase or phosphodiesterase